MTTMPSGSMTGSRFPGDWVPLHEIVQIVMRRAACTEDEAGERIKEAAEGDLIFSSGRAGHSKATRFLISSLAWNGMFVDFALDRLIPPHLSYTSCVGGAVATVTVDQAQFLEGDTPLICDVRIQWGSAVAWMEGAQRPSVPQMPNGHRLQFKAPIMRGDFVRSSDRSPASNDNPNSVANFTHNRWFRGAPLTEVDVAASPVPALLLDSQLPKEAPSLEQEEPDSPSGLGNASYDDIAEVERAIVLKVLGECKSAREAARKAVSEAYERTNKIKGASLGAWEDRVRAKARGSQVGD